MSDLIPASMMPMLQLLGQNLGGILLIVLGCSFAYKFFQASFFGKVDYWSGLEKVNWLFIPFTVLVTPLVVHSPAKDSNLIKTKTAGWVHLFWGPVFFLISLMLLVAGADMMHMPGTQVMNFVLTGGRHDVPPAITYQPPFAYQFPILKRVRRTVFKLLTADIFLDKNKQMNPFDDSKKIKLWEEDDEDRREDELDRLKADREEAEKRAREAQQQAAERQAATGGKH